MPIYMDRHFAEGANLKALADAHSKDLKIQNKYNIKFITYWFDEVRSTAFCLVDAPNKELLQNAHKEAHGNIPNEIIEVDPSIVEAFLGRVKDPSPTDESEVVPIDSAFRVIMFTDLKDSTKMTTEFGDTSALNLIHIHNVLTRNELKEFDGNEIKHTGDGIMASFITIKNAIDCAMNIQKAFSKHNMNNPQEEIHLKIGLSAGEPIEEYGDFFGKSVQLAARLCAHAQSNQILVSSDIEQLIEESHFKLVEQGEITPKGFNTPVSIFEVSW